MSDATLTVSQHQPRLLQNLHQGAAERPGSSGILQTSPHSHALGANQIRQEADGKRDLLCSKERGLIIRWDPNSIHNHLCTCIPSAVYGGQYQRQHKGTDHAPNGFYNLAAGRGDRHYVTAALGGIEGCDSMMKGEAGVKKLNCPTACL